MTPNLFCATAVRMALAPFRFFCHVTLRAERLEVRSLIRFAPSLKVARGNPVVYMQRLCSSAALFAAVLGVSNNLASKAFPLPTVVALVPTSPEVRVLASLEGASKPAEAAPRAESHAPVELFAVSEFPRLHLEYVAAPLACQLQRWHPSGIAGPASISCRAFVSTKAATPGWWRGCECLPATDAPHRQRKCSSVTVVDRDSAGLRTVLSDFQFAGMFDRLEFVAGSAAVAEAHGAHYRARL
jgi:hypothetical protein